MLAGFFRICFAGKHSQMISLSDFIASFAKITVNHFRNYLKIRNANYTYFANPEYPDFFIFSCERKNSV